VLASQSEAALDRSETFLRNQDPLRKLGAKNAVMHNTAFFNDVVGCDPRLRAAHEAAPVHHIARGRGGGVAVRDARAAADDAGDWLS
jgi:hypothetical protein